MEASKALTQVPRNLFIKLEDEPDKLDSCPLDETAPEDVRLACAEYLDVRLRLIREAESQDGTPAKEDMPEIRLESTPEIRLEATPGEHEAATNDPADQTLDQSIHLDTDGAGTPAISLSAPDSPSSNSSAPTTLLRSRSYSASGAHPRHASALLRLLYVHSTLNPANRSPQIASLLVPLYSALIEEIEPEDASHVEADAFWLFEAMVGEFSELEDPEGANVWMRKMSEEIKSADTELAEDLVRTWSLNIQHRLIFRDHSNTRAWILYSHIIHSESERNGAILRLMVISAVGSQPC